MGEPTRLSEVRQKGMALWCLCRQCGYTTLLDPIHLAARVKNNADELDVISRRLKCSRCTGRDSKLIPARRP